MWEPYDGDDLSDTDSDDDEDSVRPSEIMGQHKTRAANNLHQAIVRSFDTIPIPHRWDDRLMGRLTHALILRVHHDRHRLFNYFTAVRYCYYCIDRTWKHYYEWMTDCNHNHDILYTMLEDQPITIRDLFLKDRQSLPPFCELHDLSYPFNTSLYKNHLEKTMDRVRVDPFGNTPTPIEIPDYNAILNEKLLGGFRCWLPTKGNQQFITNQSRFDSPLYFDSD